MVEESAVTKEIEMVKNLALMTVVVKDKLMVGNLDKMMAG